MGRMDIDYAVLEDAFLRYQTKPRLSQHGDLYYEVRRHTAQHSTAQQQSGRPHSLTHPPTHPCMHAGQGV
jgi:hypothetical protein